MSANDTETPDEQDIPLLNDVVQPDELVLSETQKKPDVQLSSNQQKILDGLREGIAAQLNEELQPIVSEALATAITQITEQTRQILYDELSSTLENRIRSLIQEAVEQQFTKPK